MKESQLASWLAPGESATLEFKRSTAELRRAGETLCGFLNGDGGRVLIGVAPDGKPVGQRASGYVAIAVFDDRIEVRSVCEFPTGIHAALLSQEHLSVQRNPLMAGAFHRTGAVQVWGRGTNRVIDACKAYGIAPPEYAQAGGVVTVTFRAAVATDGEEEARKTPLKTAGKTQVPPQVTAQVAALLARMRGDMTRQDMQDALELADRKHFRKAYLLPALELGMIEMTNPEKPNSRSQRYRLTDQGRLALQAQAKARKHAPTPRP